MEQIDKKAFGRTLLIDGDILLYKFSYRHTEKIKWGNNETVTTDLDSAIEDYKEHIYELMRKFKAKDYMLCLTGANNFRKFLGLEYKGNRSERPALYHPIKDWAIKYYEDKNKLFMIDNIEADDAMGIIQSEKPKDYIICTIDKDLKQIVGYNYNWDKRELVWINKYEGNRLLFQQIVQGDPTDGYYGCPGVGKVKAIKLLDKSEEEYKKYLSEGGSEYNLDSFYWKNILEEYKYKGIPEDYIIKQGQMANILDYTYIKGSLEHNVDADFILWDKSRIKEYKEV